MFSRFHQIYHATSKWTNFTNSPFAVHFSAFSLGCKPVLFSVQHSLVQCRQQASKPSVPRQVSTRPLSTNFDFWMGCCATSEMQHLPNLVHSSRMPPNHPNLQRLASLIQTFKSHLTTRSRDPRHLPKPPIKHHTRKCRFPVPWLQLFKFASSQYPPACGKWSDGCAVEDGEEAKTVWCQWV